MNLIVGAADDEHEVLHPVRLTQPERRAALCVHACSYHGTGRQRES